AAGLAVESQGMDGDGFVFHVVNSSTSRMDGLRFHADDRYDIDCSVQTTRGLSFSEGGSLQAGDRIEFTARIQTQLMPRSGGFTLSARERVCRMMVRYIPVLRRRVTPLYRGFVVLVAAGVHIDGNGYGLLHASELIEYHFSFINLGNLPLSRLSVTDCGGCVS